MRKFRCRRLFCADSLPYGGQPQRLVYDMPAPDEAPETVVAPPEIPPGEPKDFANMLAQQEHFFLFSKFVEENGSHFQEWLNPDHHLDAVAILTLFSATDDFKGSRKGLRELTEGLKTEPSTDTYKKAFLALNSIVGYLDKHFATLEKTRGEQEKVKEQVAGGVIGGGVEKMVENFNRGSGTHKLMTVGAIFIGLQVLLYIKDKKLPGFDNYTVKDAMYLAAAVWGVDFLSGQVRKSGKSFSQDMGIFRTVDDLEKGGALEKMAVAYNFTEEDIKTNFALANTDTRKIYQLYANEKRAGGGRNEINPARLGIYGGVDGKGLFNIMADVIVHVGERHLEKLMERKRRGQEVDEAELDRMKGMKPHEIGMEIFERKYVKPSVSFTMFHVYVNEYGDFEYTEEQKQKSDETALDKAYDVTKDGATKLGTYLLERAKNTEKFLTETAPPEILDFYKQSLVTLGIRETLVRDEVVPQVQEIRKAFPATWFAGDWFENKEGLNGQAVRTPSLPDDAGNITPGIMAILGTALQYKRIENNSAPAGEKVKYEIVAVPGMFVFPEKTEAQNRTNLDAIKNHVKARMVQRITDAHTFDATRLAHVTATIDWTNGKWQSPDIPIDRNPAIQYDRALDGGQIKKQMGFELLEPRAGRQGVKIVSGSATHEKIDEVDTLYSKEVIKKRFFKKFPEMNGLAVEIGDILSDPANASAGYIVRLRIGTVRPVEVSACQLPTPLPHTPGTSSLLDFVFVDNANTNPSMITGATHADLTGIPMIPELADHITKQVDVMIPDFEKKFRDLEEMMAKVPEDFWTKASTAFKTTRLNSFDKVVGAVKESFTGRVVQARWSAVLAYKKQEVLDRFKKDLKNEPNLKQLNALKNQHIRGAIAELDRIKTFFEKDPVSGANRAVQDQINNFPNTLFDLETMMLPGMNVQLYMDHTGAMRTKLDDGSIVLGTRWNSLKNTEVDLPHELYAHVMRVWHANANPLVVEALVRAGSVAALAPAAAGAPANPRADQLNAALTHIYDKIIAKLNAAQTADGRVTFDNIPAETDAVSWGI